MHVCGRSIQDTQYSTLRPVYCRYHLNILNSRGTGNDCSCRCQIIVVYLHLSVGGHCAFNQEREAELFNLLRTKTMSNLKC
jgi:hypothetical protein